MEQSEQTRLAEVFDSVITPEQLDTKLGEINDVLIKHVVRDHPKTIAPMLFIYHVKDDAPQLAVADLLPVFQASDERQRMAHMEDAGRQWVESSAAPVIGIFITTEAQVVDREPFRKVLDELSVTHNLEPEGPIEVCICFGLSANRLTNGYMHLLTRDENQGISLTEITRFSAGRVDKANGIPVEGLLLAFFKGYVAAIKEQYPGLAHPN